MFSGWIKESYRIKDYIYEKAFGVQEEPILPLGRSIDWVPLVYQGNMPACVLCTITWIQQYIEGIQLDWKSIIPAASVGKIGFKPSRVLKFAYDVGIKGEDGNYHRINEYFFLLRKNPQVLYSALKRNPIMIGADYFEGLENHMMAAFDVDESGKNLVCASWRNENKQEIKLVPFDQVSFACLIKDKPEKGDFRLPFLQAVASKITSILS